MKIIRNIETIRGIVRNSVVTIGNFDGVHLGHREILRRAHESARTVGCPSVVVTFIPHPLKLFPRVKSLRLITTYAEKEGLIRSSGIDYLVTIPFTEQFASLTAIDFVTDVLVDALGMKKLIIGYDYAFGYQRQGNVALLEELSGRLGFELEVLPPIGNDSEVYSSTRIREMIGGGDVKEVVSLLGRHFFIDGTVIHGHHRGKDLGFPTANLATNNELIPLAGVYAVKVKQGYKVYDGACNIGCNPTFGEAPAGIEVFLLDFAGDLYGCPIRVYFIERIREERKFTDPAALQQAIQRDVARCREILSSVSIIQFHPPAESPKHGEE